jgi:hypothetical protein
VRDRPQRRSSVFLIAATIGYCRSSSIVFVARRNVHADLGLGAGLLGLFFVVKAGFSILLAEFLLRLLFLCFIFPI